MADDVPLRHQYPNYEDRRRNLRREGTLPEALLWRHLLNGGIEAHKFRRQQQLGPYIADFYCAAARLVIEVDGGQHFEPQAQTYDRERSAYFESRGLGILRFTNTEVLQNLEGVIEAILEAIGAPSP